MKNAYYLLLSANELVPQDRRYADGGVIALDENEIAVDTLELHPDFLHDAQALLVADHIVRLDSVKTEITEPEPQNCAERLGRELFAPAGAVEHVADLGGVRGEVERGKAARADHLSRRFFNDRPVVVIAAFVSRKSVREELERVALVFVVRPRQVLRDLGITGVFVQVGAVALFEFAERQPSRLEGRRVPENAFEFFFVRTPSLPSLYPIYFTIKGTRVQHFFELTDKNFQSIIKGTVCLMAKIF